MHDTKHFQWLIWHFCSIQTAVALIDDKHDANTATPYTYLYNSNNNPAFREQRKS